MVTVTTPIIMVGMVGMVGMVATAITVRKTMALDPTEEENQWVE